MTTTADGICRTCNGYGWRHASVPNGRWLTVVYRQICPDCNGVGGGDPQEGATQ